MSGFVFTKATKKSTKARIALAGPAGSSKTYTALRLATAMCQRVAVIDTEHGSASKYASDFTFDVLELKDFHPENYVKAIQAAQAAGYEALIIDSAGHEWSGKNGCLELVDLFAKRSKGGNQWAAWADVTPLHNAFIEAIHGARLHLIATFRAKQDYLQTEDKNGKTKIQKVGLAPITRDGVEYEFDLVGELDIEHTLVITKSRCKELADQILRHPGEELARAILDWLSDGAAPVTPPAVPPRPATSATNGPTLQSICEEALKIGAITDAWLKRQLSRAGVERLEDLKAEHAQALSNTLLDQITLRRDQIAKPRALAKSPEAAG